MNLYGISHTHNTRLKYLYSFLILKVFLFFSFSAQTHLSFVLRYNSKEFDFSSWRRNRSRYFQFSLTLASCNRDLMKLTFFFCSFPQFLYNFIYFLKLNETLSLNE